MIRTLALAPIALLLAVSHSHADPRDEAYWRTFYVTPIGAWGAEDPVPSIDGNAPYPFGIGSVTEYRDSMLLLTGGEEPLNLRVGISNQTQFLSMTQGAYYDHIYEPSRIGDLRGLLNQAILHDIPMGVHLNGTPWADEADQSIDTLLNHLEILENGRYLARDRNGNFRRGVQDPTLPENYDDFAPALEMQLTLSRYAQPVRDSLARNLRMNARVLGWYREQHPDLIIYNSASSEYAQHTLDDEWFDYSEWSRQEFRDWLSGSGAYDGEGKYASLADFNSQFTGGNFLNPTPPGFPFPTWDAVEPPTDPNWTASQRRGQWWLLWQEFRIHQVASLVQFHQDQVIAAGWSPDRTYGHQIPFDPNTTNNTFRRYATPWTTTFTHSSSNGITTYGGNASSTTRFAAMYSNDKNWGIFEYNPISDSVATNRAAIDATWNNKIHVLTPYAWGGQELYRIQGGSALEVALREFLFDNRNNRYDAMERWEAHPDSRDTLWSMSRPSHVPLTNEISGAAFDTGVYSGTITGLDPYLFLQLDATRPLQTRDYSRISFRLYLEEPIQGFGQIFWFDVDGGVHSLDFTPEPGWNVYQINLVHVPGWSAKPVTALRMDIPGVAGTDFALDWVRLHATHAWEFMNAQEIYSPMNLTGVTVGGGTVTATTTNDDGYFYLSTDKRNPAEDADRVFVDARTHNLARFNLTSSHDGTGELFWWRRGDPNFAVHSFAVTAGTHQYEIDLAALPGWEGQVTRLRIDPVNVNGATFSLGHFAIHPPMVSPRATFLETIANTSRPYFHWDMPTETGLSGILYDFQLATDWDFNDMIVDQQGLTGNDYLHPEGDDLDGLHFWRVRARSAEGWTSPWSVPMYVFLRLWTMDRVEDLILANHFTAPTVSGGTWEATTTGVDPYVFFNNGMVVIDTTRYRALRMRVKLAGSALPQNAEVYAFKADGTFWQYPFLLPANNEWQEIEINLTGNPNWTGEVSLIRFDPTTNPGITVTMDRAELIPNSVPPDDPIVGPGDGEIIWDFAVDGDFMGWALDNALANGEVSDGSLKVTATGEDPFMISPAFAPRPGSDLRYIVIRMRNTTNDPSAQIFWQTQSQPAFAAERSVSFTISTNDAEFQTYVLDMGSVAGWAGEAITRLRIDPIGAWFSGPSLIEFDEIRITDEEPTQPTSISDWWVLH